MSVDPSNRAACESCAGVDWAKDDHAVCVSSTPTGRCWTGSPSPHTAAGLKRLVRRLLAAGVDEVGIERGDGRWSRRCCRPS